MFDKRVILFGSEGSAKVFSSEAALGAMDEQNIMKTNLPTAVVEAVDPIVLNMKLVDMCECRPCCDCELSDIPPCICSCFGSDLCFGNEGKRVYVTLGQFSIIRLSGTPSCSCRSTTTVCRRRSATAAATGSQEDPCEVFRQVKFPVDEFFPPNSSCSRNCSRSC